MSDFDLEYRDEFGSTGETARGHARLQADAALAAGLSGSAGGEWVGESGRSTYIVDGAGEVPVERDVWAAFAEARWQPTARLLVHRRRPGVAHHAGRRCRPTRTASRPGRRSTTRRSST